VAIIRAEKFSKSSEQVNCESYPLTAVNRHIRLVMSEAPLAIKWMNMFHQYLYSNFIMLKRKKWAE